MASLLTNSDTYSSGLSYYGSTSRQLQTFTMPSGYDKIEYIDLYLRESGTLPGNYTLNLYATSGGLPTGSSLASLSLTSGDIDSSYGWLRFNITDTIVTPGAKYAIVISQTSATGLTNSVYWGHSTSATYSGGASYYSTNSGSSYTSIGGDYCFRVYGSQSATVPTVTTGTSGSESETGTVITGSNVTSDGGATITDRGVCYSDTNSTPTTSNTKTATTGTTGSYNITITGLTAGTHYYLRAYAKNSQGTSYGSVTEFNTTTNYATVVSGGYSNVTSTTATIAGEVTSDHGATVTMRGIAYGTSSNPTIAGDYIVCSSGVGSFSGIVSSLTENTTYHYRAFATNSVGTSYGNDVTFTTKDLIKYWGEKIVATSTGVLTSVDIYAKLSYGTSGILKAYIYSDNSGSPDTLLETLTPITITNSGYQLVTISTNTSVTNTDSYWIVFEDLYVPGSYHIKIGYNSAGGYASGALKYTLASAPSTWETLATAIMTFEVSIQPTMSTNYDISVDYKKRYI